MCKISLNTVSLFISQEDLQDIQHRNWRRKYQTSSPAHRFYRRHVMTDDFKWANDEMVVTIVNVLTKAMLFSF